MPIQPIFRQKIVNFIARYWLAAGLIALLCGLFLLPNLKSFTKLYYTLFAAPSLLALLVAPGHAKTLLGEPLVRALIILSIWILLSLIWTQADDSLLSLAKRPIYVLLLVAGCVLIAQQDRSLLHTLLNATAILASLAAVISLYEYAANPQSQIRLVGTGALENPLLSSQVFGFFFTFWLCKTIRSHGPMRWFAALASGVLFITLLATGSRTPLLAIAATGLWLAICTNRNGIYICLGLLLAVAASLFAVPGMLDRGISYRPEIWLDAIQSAAQHPWLGTGFNSTYIVSIPGLQYLSDPHNVELAVLLELGVIGLVLWLVMYGLALVRCWQLRRDPWVLLASALVVHGLAAGMTEGGNFLSRPNENWFIHWIPLALAAAFTMTSTAVSSQQNNRKATDDKED